MPSLKDEIKNNKPVWVWRTSLLALIGVLGFLGSWVFAEVSAAPKVYVSKEEQRIRDQRQDKDRGELERKIDEGFRETQRLILELHKK